MSLVEFKNPLSHVWQYSNRTLAELKKRLLGYTELSLLLTQSGATAPNFEILKNELGVNITFDYISDGVYVATFTGNIFESPDEYVTISGISTDGADVNIVQAVPAFLNVLTVESYQNGVLADDVIGSFAPCVLTIRKYN